MTEPKSHFIEAADGLKLHAVEYGVDNGGLPVVCLPGLARTVGDFAGIARALAADGRRVVVIEYRGRGLSGYDSNLANYNPLIEIRDALTVFDTLSVSRAVFVGTSRGGILTMLMAPTEGSRIAGVVLNDIGPELMIEGLVRIKGYVGKLPQPKSIDDGAAILKELFEVQFPNYTAADWLGSAELTWREENGTLKLSYDPNLSVTVKDVEPDQTPPTMWDQFDALKSKPLMLVRGALTDLISSATAKKMAERHPGMELIEIADEGHPVRLDRPEVAERIKAFVRACDV
ncbi:acyl-CoA esterase [Variibacter gotjawalensis]|uniref:Acyl-CoA esterase n=1 Tax=Variibacter gotjawalensis TaxID=1333996 RepID=A0A0S3PXR9_9BRAD|nr:alpha/beta hydrolase [Variibacter gotjawalensis]NIK46575.1 pimeloyl-ACP methyl ester carboxylesterase [Variibacter gotjawalensis]RZS48479.1 pimeloyl-ACP methyl ester carboxylesterase [Variibacter gotjawalensis]BAT60741.1 acyl-CoA esterase [Variibacter gotjawalensis]